MGMEGSKHRARRWLLLAAGVLAAAAVWFFCSYTIILGRVLPRRADVFDLRGLAAAPEEIDAVAQKHPDKTILWDVPLSGGAYSSDSESLTIRSLSESDIPLFSRFPALTSVDASECTDYAALLALRETYPALDVTAFVRIGDTSVRMGAARTSLPAETPLGEILEKLPYLPELRRVFFTDGTVSYEMQDALQSAFPDILFHWNMELLGKVYSSSTGSVTFAGRELSAQEVDTLCANLFRFPDLKRVDVTGCGLTQEQRDALRASTDAMVVYEMKLYGKTVLTDARELDFSNTFIGYGGWTAIEDVLDEFPQLEKVVMCDCGISNEDMAALNDRHENVRFVWRVYFSEFSLRTDDTNFIAARVRNQFPIYSNEMEVLKYCPDIQALDLGHKDITSLNFLKYVPHLKYLILAENDVNDISPIGELQELTYLEMFWTKCEDITPLKNCKNLTDLNISYIYCRPWKCLEVLKEMPQLERLWYCGNNLTDEQQQELHDALPDTEMYLSQHGEPTGSTWRTHPHYYEMRDFFGMYYMPGGTNGLDADGNLIIIPDE